MDGINTATAISRLFEGEPEEADVLLRGWVRTYRESKSVGFIELNDGSTVKCVQVVTGEKLALNVGAAIEVTGRVVLTPGARQAFEIAAREIRIEAASGPDYPLQKKRHTFEYLRAVAHLRPRTNTYGAVFRVRSEAAWAINDFFHSRGFVLVHSPIITSNDAEGAGELFRLSTLDMSRPPRTGSGDIDYSADFFGRETGLTVSGQLEAECFALAFGKTYTFGPAFRAENSNTPRHAAEFWMVEPEVAFAGLEDIMRLARRLLRHVVEHVLKSCGHEMEFLNGFIDGELLDRLNSALSREFPRLTYTEAIGILEKEGNFDFPVYWGCDIQTEHERFLAETYCKGPLFITDYPKDIKAFYMRQNGDGTVAAMDLLVPGIGELAGGSQREERLDMLRNRMRELNMSEERYWWYLDLRRYGGARHAGFGLGFERLIMYLTGMTNIRDVSPFPRTVGKAEF